MSGATICRKVEEILTVMTLNRFFSLLILSIIAALTWWLEDVVQTSHTEAARKESNRPDFYMQDFTMRDYSPLGELRRRGSGDSLLRYPKDDSLEIKKLAMQSYQQGKAPLSISANSASLTDDGQQIFLAGNVIIKQDKTQNQDSMLVTTEKLFIDSNRNYMETDVAINIKTGKHDVSGIGMQAWTDYKKIRLLKKVRGIHEP